MFDDEDTNIGFTHHARNSKHPEFWAIIKAIFGGACLFVGWEIGLTADILLVLVFGIGLCCVVFSKKKDGSRLIITAFKNDKDDYQNF